MKFVTDKEKNASLFLFLLSTLPQVHLVVGDVSFSVVPGWHALIIPSQDLFYLCAPLWLSLILISYLLLKVVYIIIKSR